MIRYLAQLIVFCLAAIVAQAQGPTPPGSETTELFPLLEGQWRGGFSVPGSGQEICFNLVSLAGGQYFGMLDVPQQKVSRAPVQVRQVSGTDSVCLLVPTAKSLLRARRSPEGDELEGIWSQPGLTKRVVLCRAPLPAALQPSARAMPTYQEEDVVVVNYQARLQLGGTLTMPAGSGPYPAVVLISDLGEQNRDGQAADNPTDFRLLGAIGDYLTRHGFAVLRLDDRGVNSSEGRNSQATPTQRAGDVEAALNYLRTRPEVDMLHLGLIGHGEGTSIAMLVAAQPLPPAFVIGLGAYGLTGYDTLLGQLEADLQARKIPLPEQELRLRRQSSLYDLIRYSTNLTQTHGIVANLLHQADDTLSPDAAQRQSTALLTPSSRAFLAFNPLESLAAVHCPVLLITGKTDEQAPAATHLEALERELRANGNRHVTAYRPTGVNHLMQPPKIQWTMLDGQMRPLVAPEVMETLYEWVSEQVWSKNELLIK